MQVKPDTIPITSAGDPVGERKVLQTPVASQAICKWAERWLLSAAVVAIGMDSCEYSICYKRDSLETPHRS